MILFTIKKATAIYRLINSFLFIVFSLPSYASVDLVSYCFENKTNLAGVESSLSFLLLPREKVFLRPEQNCIDVLTSNDRANLLEKFLSKRFTLINEGGRRASEVIQEEQCQIELKTTKKKLTNTKDFKLGNKNRANVGTDSIQEVSTSQLLLGSGRSGSLDLEGRSLYIECRKTTAGIYHLVFSYNEKDRAKVSSEISVTRGEVVQIAQVTNELDTKNKTLGIPQSQYQTTQGQENISYELKIN